MKIERNQKYFTIARYAFLTIVVSAAAVMIIFNLDAVFKKLSSFTAITTPIIIGIFCAYVLNPLMTRLENGMFGKWARSEKPSHRTRARVFALTFTMLFILSVLTLFLILVLPQLTSNIVSFFNNLEDYMDQVRGFLDDLSKKIPLLGNVLGNSVEDIDDFLVNIWNQYSTQLMSFAGDIASGLLAVLDAMKNVLIGLTISVYLLAKKEMFIGQSKKMIFAFMKRERAQRFLNVCREASKKFLGSIVGKIVEAFIVSILIMAVLWIARIPYAPLLAVIMFLFNLIPYVGPIIGAVPCCVLLLMSESPGVTVWFIVIIIVIQLIDGNVIAPWVLGDSTGLPAVWVLVSIVIGGGFFGMLGMFLGVPVCAVVYMLFKDFVEGKLRKQNLPESTSQYVGDVDFITPDYVYEPPVRDASEPPEPAEEASRKQKKPNPVTRLRNTIRKKSVEHTRRLTGRKRK